MQKTKNAFFLIEVICLAICFWVPKATRSSPDFIVTFQEPIIMTNECDFFSIHLVLLFGVKKFKKKHTIDGKTQITHELFFLFLIMLNLSFASCSCCFTNALVLRVRGQADSQRA